MGVNDLWKTYLPGIKSLPPRSLSELANLTIGVDISFLLHAITRSEEVCYYLASLPPYPPPHLQAKLNYYHVTLMKHAKEVVFVFDGARHDMKDVARQNRDNPMKLATDRITSFLTKCRSYEDAKNDKDRACFHITNDDRKDYLKALKDTTVPNQHVISMVVDWMKETKKEYCCAPIEAEWQLRQMELDGRIDACFSIDSDCVILGSKHVIFNINWVEETFLSYRQCEILAQPAKFPLARYPITNWPIIACLLGNDYISNVPNVGGKTVFIIADILNALNEWSVERIQHILSHPSEYKNNKLGLEDVAKKLRSKYTVSENHWVQFRKSVNLFRYCPVLDISGKLIPLNPLPMLLDGQTQPWDNICIGFFPHSPLQVKEEDYWRAAKFDGCSFQYGHRLESFDVPLYSIKDNPECVGAVLPAFARCSIPICAMSNFILLKHVGAYVGHHTFRNRDNLEDQARAILASFGKRVVLRVTNIPTLYAPWLSNNVLRPTTNGVDWQHVGYFDIVNDTTICPTINDDFFQFAFPTTRENRMERAMELIGAYSLDVLNLKWRKMELANGSIVHAFRMYVLPSVKNKVTNANSENSDKMTTDGYLVFTVFGISNALPTFLEYPSSCCGCPDGRSFCSHLAATLGVMAMMQEASDVNEFESVCGNENALSSQSLAIPIETYSLYSNS